jgi:hypothetical protein
VEDTVLGDGSHNSRKEFQFGIKRRLGNAIGVDIVADKSVRDLRNITSRDKRGNAESGTMLSNGLP